VRSVHWLLSLGAGLAVTGRIRGIGQNVLQSSFHTGSGGSPSYCHMCFLTAPPEENFIRNIIILLYINYIIICTNNNTLINNYYGRLPDLIVIFKIPLSTHKNFFEIHRQFGHASSERFTSPDLRFLCRIICPLHALAINSQCPTKSDCNPQRKLPSLRTLTGRIQKRQDTQCMYTA